VAEKLPRDKSGERGEGDYKTSGIAVNAQKNRAVSAPVFSLASPPFEIG
jgi:hypothetical protein